MARTRSMEATKMAARAILASWVFGVMRRHTKNQIVNINATRNIDVKASNMPLCYPV